MDYTAMFCENQLICFKNVQLHELSKRFRVILIMGWCCLLKEGVPSFELCPLLAKRWQREVVEDWPRISHNTEIEMNFERSNEKAVIPELLFHSSTTIRIFLSLC